MPVPRANFREGGRVRGAEWFKEIAGVTGTVVKAILVTWEDGAAQDLLVRFDRPVTICEGERPTWTFCHSAHNFEYIDEAVETQRDMKAISDGEDLPSSRPLNFPSGGEAAFRPFIGAAHRLDEQESAPGDGNPAHPVQLGCSTRSAPPPRQAAAPASVRRRCALIRDVPHGKVHIYSSSP